MDSNQLVERVALLSLHSSPYAPPGPADVGGMNIYVRGLAEQLGDRGLKVDVFTRRTDPYIEEIVPLSDGVRLVQLQGGPPRPIDKSVLPLHLPEMVDSLRHFAVREDIEYDLLHSHYWISGLAAINYRGGRRIPIVHMFHTLSRVKEFYSGRPDPRDTMLRFDGERSVLRGVDTVVGATHEEKELIEGLYGISPPTFAVIPPGLNLDLFRPHDRAASRKALGIESDRVILFVGRLDRIKGFDLLLRSLAELRPRTSDRLKLFAVGDFCDDQDRVEDYAGLTRALGLGDVVEFQGTVPQCDMPRYYSAADICAVPSAYESFGMVAVESMACQTPVVAFAVGGLETTIRDGQTGFLAAPGCSREFTRTLEAALTATNLETIGRRARISVQRYDWSTVTDRTLDLYERIARLRNCFLAASGQG